MLFQSWLLTVLVPLAFGAPFSQEPNPPTLTIMDLANATSPEKLAESGNRIVLGSKNRLQGSASTDEYSALGIAVGHKGKSGTAGGTSWVPGKMGLNRANKMNRIIKSGAHDGGSNTTLSDESGAGGGTLAESSGGRLGGTSSHGSGSSTAGQDKAIGSKGIAIDTTGTGSGATTTGQQGTTPSTGTASASGSTISGTNTPSPGDGITSSTSKYR